jgi:hypothetical protein
MFAVPAGLLTAKQPPPPPPPAVDSLWVSYPTQNKLPPVGKDFTPVANFDILLHRDKIHTVNVFINLVTFTPTGMPIRTQVWTDTRLFTPQNVPASTVFFKNCNLPAGLYEVQSDWGILGEAGTPTLRPWVFNPSYFFILE